jgi:hypothetical protein
MYEELREGALRDVIQHWQSTLKVGVVYTTKTLTTFELEKFGYKKARIQPPDHCYNKTNKGNLDNIRPTDDHAFSTPDNIPLFECVTRGHFKYLGANYPYNGICVLADGSIYGEWKNGTFSLSPEQSAENGE